jgi:hypothetical protein
MRLPTTLTLIACVAALLAGCGGSDGTATSQPDVAGTPAQRVRSSWEANRSCRHPQGASRWGCSVGSYHCQAVVTDRGWSVSCAKPGASVGFTVPPRK